MINYKHTLCSLLATLATISGAFAQKSVTLTLVPSTKYQYIDGFGCCGMTGQWADVYTQSRVNMLWGQKENQIGLNIMRIRINPNEYNWGEYGNPIKWARAVNKNMQVFATPWTPPKRFKTSKTEKYQNEFGTWVWPLVEHSWGGEGSNGGTINDDSIPSYAIFLERYRATMEAKGCPVDIISVQNECDYTPTVTENGVEHASYESCIWSPNQMAKMVKALRDTLDPKCKVMGPETFGWGQSNYNNTLVGKQDAVDNIDIWGNHQYGSNSYSFVNTVRSKTKKNMWMTEFLWSYGGDDYKNDFGQDATYTGQFKYEYRMINSIETALQAGYSAYVYYNANDDFFASSYGGSSSAFNKRAYVFKHYAKYATGKTRIKTTKLGTYASNLTGGSAYQSANGDTVSLYILNPTTENYTLTVNLPFDAAKIEQVATSDAVSCHITDITDKYTAGTKKLKVTLLPGVFYTFVFQKDADESQSEIIASAKKNDNVNPVMPISYIADPTGIEYNGRLYVYGTNDQQQYDYCSGDLTNNYGKIQQLACISTNDMANWTYHGTIDVKKAAPWIYTSWAPSIVSREETDGKTHFYMYFTNTASGIGVLTATSPLGPWTDPLGKALIDGNTAGIGSMSNIIDPGALVDGDRAYLAFGGGDVQNDSTDQYPGNARIVELGSDMISLKGDIVNVQAPYHFEANELNKIGGKIAFSYCSRWSDPTSACAMRYITADSITGKWTSRGVYFKNPGQSGYPYGNNHTHIQNFQGNNYILYHTQYLENANGINAGYRNLAINRISINQTTRKITQPAITDVGAPFITENLPVMGETVEAETFGNAAGIKCTNDDELPGNCFVTGVKAGSWTELRSASFPESLTDDMMFTATLQGTGTLEVRLGSVDSTAVASLDFSSTEMQTVSAPLNIALSEVTSGKHDIYLVFTSASDVKFDSWQIAASTATGINTFEGEEQSDVNTPLYNLQGQRVFAKKHGNIYVKQGKKVVF